ncbi:MAG TPA: outer membrane protein assembly factor BamD [Candidatus Binataceae bacterium]
MKRVLLILVACSLLPVAACSLRKKPTGEDYWAQGQLDFAKGEYKASIENYQELIDKYPFSPFAEDAEMRIGLAHYQMKEYAEAIGALDDFQRMHPTSKNLELVSYYVALSYYEQIGREDQDQSKTQSALKHFEEVEQRFPEGGFAELAHEHIEVCREMLARHQMVVGNYYYTRANFKAAESRLAELMQRYPDTPVAPDALYELAISLEKEGKKYSAAQAFTALLKHYPDTPYADKSRTELKKLKQPIDTEEDPLPLVLAESGFGKNSDTDVDRVIVRQRGARSSALDASPPGASAPAASVPATPSRTQYGADGLPILDQPAAEAPDTQTPPAGPATLKTIRLSSADPPLSMIFDLTGPVEFEKRIQDGPGYSTVTVVLKNVRPQVGMEHHFVFDKSIFRDCDVASSGQATTITVNTLPVSKFAIVPLEGPPRLLVSFTPRSQAQARGDSPVSAF